MISVTDTKTKLVKPLKVLLYEDKDDYAQSFKTNAQRHRIIVERVDNVDDLLERLEENLKKYHYVILDARAYRHEGQQAGTEHEIYLAKIFQELERLQHKHQTKIFYCINTGFADLKLKIADTVDCPIFEKGEEDKLFAKIIEDYHRTEEAGIDFKFPEIFQFASIYFSAADLEVLYDLFKKEKYCSTAIADRVSNLSNLRRITEHLIDIIHVRYLNGQPVPSSPGVRLREITDYLNGNNEIPTHIYGIITNIRKTASNYASHTPEQASKIGDYPDANIIEGYAKGLTAVFSWAQSKLN
jgi:hypothetical protein